MLYRSVFIVILLFFALPVSAEIAVVPRTEEKTFCPTKLNEHASQDLVEQYTKTAVVVVQTPTLHPTRVSVSEKQLTQEKPSSLNGDAIFEMINNHRASLGLPSFQKEEKLCALAEERGPELYDEIFVTGNIHGGFYARNIPFWITENMKYGSSEQDVFDWWMGSYIHRKAIEGDFQYSCGECYGNSCVQLFTSYVSK